MRLGPARPRATLALLTAAHAVGTVNLMAIAAMAPHIQADLAASSTAFGAIFSAYFATQMCCVLPFGALVDRVGVRAGLVLAGLVLALGAVTFALAGGLGQAMLGAALMGAGYTFTNPSSAKAIVEWLPRERRATAMGIKQTGVPLGGAVAAALGTAAPLGWPRVFLAIAALDLILVAASLPLPRGSREARARGPSPLAFLAVMRIPDLNRLSVATCGYNIGQQSLLAYLVLFLREGLRARPGLAAFCFAAVQVASAAGRIGWGALSDRAFGMRRKPVLVLIGLIGAGLFLALAAGAATLALVPAAVLVVLLGAVIGGFPPLMQTTAIESAPPHLAGAAVGHALLVSSVGAILGPPAFGLLVDLTGGWALSWLACGGLALAAALLLALRFDERAGFNGGLSASR